MVEEVGYDIIGDIHGHANELEALLHHLDYRKHAGAWRHPERAAVFVGDLIDGGPQSTLPDGTTFLRRTANSWPTGETGSRCSRSTAFTMW